MTSTVAVEDLVRTHEGLVSSRVFADADVYHLELERIFARTWLFVAHESELSSPGDFVTRSMGEDPVIVARGRDGQVRVLLNVCRHRGRRVCVEDFGNASHFQCGYHGWTYTNNGNLTGVPFFESYQGRLEKAQYGLREARVGTYRGLIFATWSPEGESLDAYLGDMRWILDLMFGRTDDVRVAGPPLRWAVDANWKLGAGNFGGDAHHLGVTHGFTTALGLKATRVNRKAYAAQMGNGHLGGLAAFADESYATPYLALPREVWPEIERNLSPEQLQIIKPLQLLAGNVFPNLGFLNTASHTAGEWGGPEGQPISFLTLRQWQPRGPDQMEMWSWVFVDATAPERWQELSQTCYQRVFGVAGMFEQDDLENWAEISGALRGYTARELWLHYGMSMDETPATDWPGPGRAFQHHTSLGEGNERVFYDRWRELIGRD